MAGMRILHTADLHLKTADDERWEALSVILDKAEESNAGVVVICGDMFDKHAEAQRLKPRLRELFDSRPTPVIILPGNHDQKGFGADDYFGERVAVLADASKPIDIGDTRIAGLPFENVAAEGVLERLLSLKSQVREDATNILLFHGELVDMIPEPGAFGDEDEHEYMPVRLSTFAGLGFDFVLAGHFHRGYEVRRYEGGYFVYPGSPVSVTKKEKGIRNVNLVEPGVPPQPLPLDTYHAAGIDVRLDPFDASDPIENIRTLLRDVHPKAALYLSVSGFADLARLGRTEAEFEEALRQIENEQAVAEVSRRWRDVGAILNNELFKRFNALVEGSELALAERGAVRDMVIDASTETMHED